MFELHATLPIAFKGVVFLIHCGLFSIYCVVEKSNTRDTSCYITRGKQERPSTCYSYRSSVKKEKRKRKREMEEKSAMNEEHWNKKREIPAESRARAQTTHPSTKTAASSKQEHPQLQRQKSSSEPTIKVVDKINTDTDLDPSGRQRSSSHTVMSTSSAHYFIQNHSASLTENAKKLSEEEISALVIDIFKPLDFYEILFDRMKNNDQQGNNSGQSDPK